MLTNNLIITQNTNKVCKFLHVILLKNKIIALLFINSVKISKQITLD